MMINFDDKDFRVAAAIGIMEQSRLTYAPFLPEAAQILLSDSKYLLTPDHELGEKNMLNVLENLDLPSLNFGFAQSVEDVNPNDIAAQPTQNVRVMAQAQEASGR
jgi:hypothetical protein